MLETLWAALPALLESGTRDLHLLLAVAADLVARFGRPGAPPAGLEGLASRSGRSRLVTEARRLRSVEPASAGERRRVARDVLARRLDRAAGSLEDRA
ncbi:hypothetical protein [Actinomadura sp. HBU206391]|uniref:hypothetical protein n=1 Tax=Actinomadura sp. HBU206391 TaxID=2731692 RepID=UPI00164F7032|nr:hypothetical protein [Actinomadura sp. HBU206391]MBC6463377.1 hypothetical protein [Actinomadura sp. HBU206391]